MTENVYNSPPPAPEIDGTHEEQGQPETRHEEEQYIDDGRPWYPGRAREEFNRKLSGRNGDQDDDPVQVSSYKYNLGSLLIKSQWARNRRREENERDGDYGPEDYFDAATRRNREEDEADEFAETMLLVVLTIAVSALLYVRGRWVERARREAQAPQQQQGNGVPPRPPQGQPPENAWPRPGQVQL